MAATIILFGGQGSERLVSVASAQNVAAHLEGALWFWNAEGGVWIVPKDELLAHPKPFEMPFVPTEAQTWPSLESAFDAVASVAPAFFLALHGDKGEDGTVQQWLEARALPFTGSGSAASRNAFDKAAAKEIAHRAGIRTARGCIAEAADGALLRAAILKAVADFGNTVIKPVKSGSSEGLHFLKAGQDAAEIIDAVVRAQSAVLIEECLTGREITVGVIEQDGKLIGLPPSEVLLGNNVAFDYRAKYLGGATEITPAELTDRHLREAQDIATRMHAALGCRGYSRTDLILTDGGYMFLETNTLPGLTKASFMPQQLAAAAIPFAQFVKSQIAIANSR